MRVCVSATCLADSDLTAGMKGLRVLMDQAAMYNAERWLEIAEVMTFETPAIEQAAIETTDIAAAEITETIETQTIEARSARVLSIAELRQKLGIERCEPALATAPPPAGRPRIVRRREMETEQFAAG